MTIEMIPIKDRENELFERWQFELPESQKFIRDGVVSEYNGTFTEYRKTYEFVGWKNSSCKILFLLKEANDDKTKYSSNAKFLENNWDLRQFMFDGTIRCLKNERKNKLTSGNIARWSYGIKELVEKGIVAKWDKAILRGNKVGRLKHLKSICVVNLSKQPGGAVTKNKELEAKFVNYNKSYLHQQFKLYADTDIIICCGDIAKTLFKTIFFDIYEVNYISENERIYDEISTYQVLNGPLLIYYYHPQQRNYSNEHIYDKLMKVIKEAYKIKQV